MPDITKFGPQINKQDACGFCMIRVILDDAGNAVDWEYICANEKLAELDGKRVDELVGHRYSEVFPQAADKWLRFYWRAACNGESMHIDDVNEERGSYIHAEAFPTGAENCCACIFYDFKTRHLEHEAEREQLQEAIERERAAEHMAEQAEIIAALGTLYSTIVTTNIATHASRVVKYPQEANKYIANTDTGSHDDNATAALARFISADDRERMGRFLCIDTLPERMRDTDTVAEEFMGVNGSFYVGRFIAKRRDEGGKVTSVLFVAREITQEKQKELNYMRLLRESAQEAKNANLSKTNFLRRMSHDIRTPLNGIIGMLRLMDRNEGNPVKYRECYDKITRSTDYLLDIVNNVLDITKMETDEIELEHKPFDLEALLRGTISVVETNASQNSVLYKKSPDDLQIRHRHVIGSPVHINRILMNIASNGIKYNRAGGSISVSCREVKSDGETATYELCCVDTGQGMSEEFQKRAFEAYTREGKPTTTGFSGSGLGLSIVRKIVAKMGGSVELESKENVGTTVRVTMPLSLDPACGAAPDEQACESIDLTGYRALLVEDNEINTEIARLMLEDLGLEVDTAENGKQAVDKFSAADSFTYDLIFMDMMMPVMDGLEATRAIRALPKPDAASVPIIAMTANAFAEDRRACLAAGMNEHIGKPINSREIVKAVKKFIKT